MQENQNKRKITAWVILAIIAVITIVIIIMAIVNNINSSKSSQSDRLEKYAADLYQNQLKDDNTSKYVTLNLNVFERYGYDVSYFDSSSCSRTESYAVIALDDDGNIDKISTNLSCEEADNE